MATYTSTQTGLWNDSATWGGGGYPDTAGDIANVRHKVEYNITDSGSPFLGDVNIQHSAGSYTGHLAHQTGTYLNLNGRLNLIGGNYEMADDVTVAFTGNNSPDHGVYIYANDRVSFYANGTTPVAETRMSTSGDVGDYYMPVEDSSGFQTGDWISAGFRYFDLKSKEDFFNEENYPSGVLQSDGVLNTGQYGGTNFTANDNRLHNGTRDATDEGFVIHDINSNDIYVRDLVGPESSITAATSTKVTVEDATIFREGQKVIFGTGSKRTTSEITNINSRNNEITLEDNLSSTDIVGEKVYLGSLKIHKYKRTVVRTMANVAVADAAANDTTLTLNNVNDYSVGDEFYVEHNAKEVADWDLILPNNADSWRDAYQKRHKITAINNKTLTFTPALPYKVYSGAYVYKGTKPIVIKGASDDPTDGTCKPYFYAAENTTGRTMGNMTRYRRKLVLKDVAFLGIGNSSSTYQYWVRRGFNDGYWRYSHTHEGIIIDGMGNSNCNYGFRSDGPNYASIKNVIIANSYRGFYSGREGNTFTNVALMNCRRPMESLNAGDFGGRIAYFRNTRCWDYNWVYTRNYGMANVVYQMHHEQEYNNYAFAERTNLTQCHFVIRYYPVTYISARSKVSYVKIDHISSDDQKKRYFYYDYNAALGNYGSYIYHGHINALDYKKGNDILLQGHVIRYSNLHGAYEAKHGRSTYNYPAAMQETLIIEPNETVKISGFAKIHEDNPNTNWQYRPYILYNLASFQSAMMNTDRGALFINGTGSDNGNYDPMFIGDVSKRNENMRLAQVNYGSHGIHNYDSSSHPDYYASRDQIDSKTQFKEQTITVTNNYQTPAVLTYGWGTVNNNGNYGYYFKTLVVARTDSQSLISKIGSTLGRFLPTYFTKGTVAKRQKKRFGGARL